MAKNIQAIAPQASRGSAGTDNTKIKPKKSKDLCEDSTRKKLNRFIILSEIIVFLNHGKKTKFRVSSYFHRSC